MFPLLDTGQPNPLELFQIWLNLPARSKMCEPHFTMLWAGDIPHRVFTSEGGATTEVAVIAGRLASADDVAEPLAPPPDSWASQPGADVAIWTLRLQPGARWTLPAATSAAARRKLYFFAGSGVSVAGEVVTQHAAIELRAERDVELVNTGGELAEFLLLQGRPIGEPVAQYGPFVMNTEAELRQAFDDYRRTEFGGWPWPDAGPVHGPERQRFARHADGRVETLDAARDTRVLMPNVVPTDVAEPQDARPVTSSEALMENASRGMQ
jgi:redox-sensitive bicupin YhaK (pirin superfamily)